MSKLQPENENDAQIDLASEPVTVHTGLSWDLNPIRLDWDLNAGKVKSGFQLKLRPDPNLLSSSSILECGSGSWA